MLALTNGGGHSTKGNLKLGATDLKPAIFKAPFLDATQDYAFHLYKEALEMAFKVEGINGVLQLGHFAMIEADNFAWAAELDPHDEAATTRAISEHLLSAYLPRLITNLQNVLRPAGIAHQPIDSLTADFWSSTLGNS